MHIYPTSISSHGIYQTIWISNKLNNLFVYDIVCPVQQGKAISIATVTCNAEKWKQLKSLKKILGKLK